MLVSAGSRPLAGAQVVVHYPNKTWMQAETDSFGRARFGFHSDLPITVFCAAPAFAGHAERDWRPPEPLSVSLRPLLGGGSTVFTEQTGHLPGLRGRLNPILDNLERTYLYTTNVAVDEGKPQPVSFKLTQPLLLTDVHGSKRIVRFLDMFGKSALIEYEQPEPRRHTVP